MTLPPGFTEMIEELLGEEADSFMHSMHQPPTCSVRLNSRKPGAAFSDGTPIKWCSTGLYLPERPVFTLDPLLHAGAYYVQDASSMIYREVTKRILEVLGNGEQVPLCVIDLCAAPGGKTTAIIDALPDGSKVIANEYIAKRASILRENLTKWGFPDTTVFNKDTAFFNNGGYSFDLVAVDAPCSGEGMMRKDPDAVNQWSTQLIDKCAQLQREILTNAATILKPGGFLIYSTCTFNRKENEENAQFIAEQLDLEPFDLAFPVEWGIPRGIKTSLPVYRFMPHKTQGEGLFLAVFRKPGKWIPSNIKSTVSLKKVAGKKNHTRYDTLRKSGKLLQKGTTIPDEAPEIEEILSTDFDKTKFYNVELTKDQALSYLRKESFVLPETTPKGIIIVTFNGLPLGAAKNIGCRVNNLYPKNWRIRII